VTLKPGRIDNQPLGEVVLTFDEALAIVRAQMPDESETILSNIAERLNVRALMMRWLAVHETRVVESDHPANYRYVDGRLESLTSEAAAPAQ
jgi:hypothetical protein